MQNFLKRGMKRKLRSLGVIALFFILIVCTSYVTITYHLYVNETAQFSLIQDHLESLTPIFNPQYLHEETVGDWNFDEYCVFSITKNVRIFEDITLCTQGTPEFLHHIAEQCHRWQGPISAAVYAPGEYFQPTHDLVEKLRHCNPCINRRVSWYIFYKNISGCSHTLNHSERIASKWNCSDLLFKSVLKHKIVPYPINVARNIARIFSKTKFVLSLDIELYPNSNIAPRFLRMVSGDSSLSQVPQVWVLPVFEVPLGIEPPLDKSALRRLFEQRKAISFHKHRCNECHMIPRLKNWMVQNGNEEELRVLDTIKRNRAHKLHFWEPFFIGTKEDPLFDPRLTWDGKQNKMQVAYEMCLMNYDFHILDDAFLVHSPGINRYNASKEKTKARYIAQNNKIFKNIKADLKKKYLNVTGC